MKDELDVFDFKNEDEQAEFEAGKFLEKFKNPNNDDSAVVKCKLLECVDSAPRCDNEYACSPLQTGGEDNATRDPQLNSTSSEQSPNLKGDNCGSGSCITELASRDLCTRDPLRGKSPLYGASLDPPSNNEPVDVNSDADGSMNDGSGSSPASDTLLDSVSLNGRMSDHGVDDSEVDDINMAVVICPDYVVYRDNSCLGHLVIFSCSGIKVKDSSAHGNQGTFSFEKAVDDIVDIKFQWLQRVGSVVVKLRVLSNSIAPDNDACGTSGIEELQFAVCEPNWPQTLEKINSLNDKYTALWGIDQDNAVETDGDNSFGQRQYFPNFDAPFEDVVYPEGDSDAVSISKRDVDLLQPDTFINDTIIDFYIKYLKNQIPADEKHRFHFFNSFFFRKLADLDKDPSSISDGRAAFVRVRKWTRKVDLFGKDYIFIPVNFNLHWSLIIICHPGDVAAFKDEELDKLEKVPCILHMDSIKGTHAGLKNLVQSYLYEEWKERQKDASEDVSSKFLNLRFVSLELPQQENSFDCGLFLLHYLELFLAEAPVCFSPFKLTTYSSFLNVNWFPPAEASLKRTLIERLIFGLLQNRSEEATSNVCHDKHQLSRFPENNQNEMGVEFLSEKCNATITQQGNLSNSQASQGIGITLLGATSMRNLQCVNDSGLVLREFIEPGATTSLLAQYQSYGQPSSYYHLNGDVSAREDDMETDEGYGFLASADNGFHQMTELTPQDDNVRYPSRDFGTEASWNPEICLQTEHGVKSSETSLCASDDSEDVGIIENSPLLEDAGRIEQQRCSSMDNIGCFTEVSASIPSQMLQTLAVECSKEPDKMCNNNDNMEGMDIPSCQQHPTTSVQDPNLFEQRLHEDVLVESYEQQAAKRPRLTFEGEDLTGGLPKDFHV
ncbi:putative Cysteine proteinases superfamily protein [Melia azedarach]|uniref:Cysteine proteinases superfamily protein n=1 Tax=Melia azedarach TaxID=155640 RepID=A0ACC1WQH2_MELAZ|nr:putative Cysteine proteinases superfamily protein [Melia azedarach]